MLQEDHRIMNWRSSAAVVADVVFGLVPAVLSGALSVAVLFYDLASPSSVSGLISPPPNDLLPVRLLIGLISVAGVYGSGSLFIAVLLKTKMNRFARQYCTAGLCFGTVVALAWILMNVLTISQLPASFPDLGVNIASIFLASSASLIAIKYIRLFSRIRGNS